MAASVERLPNLAGGAVACRPGGWHEASPARRESFVPEVEDARA